MKKWKELLNEFEQNDTVKIMPSTPRYYLMADLRKRGHTIVNIAKYTFRLLD